MKRIAVIAAAVAAASAAPAFAQAVPPAPSGNLTYNLTAQVAEVCGAYNFQGDVINIDFGQLAMVLPTARVTPAGQGSITYRCNVPAGFTRTITSQNNGFLTRNGVATTDNLRRIRYTFQSGGGSGLSVAETQLTAPVVTDLNGSGSFLAGQTGGVTFRANGVMGAIGGNESPGTTVFAGNYSDTVTVTIMPRM